MGNELHGQCRRRTEEELELPVLRQDLAERKRPTFFGARISSLFFLGDLSTPQNFSTPNFKDGSRKLRNDCETLIVRNLRETIANEFRESANESANEFELKVVMYLMPLTLLFRNSAGFLISLRSLGRLALGCIGADFAKSAGVFPESVLNTTCSFSINSYSTYY